MDKDRFLFLAAKLFSSEASPEEISLVKSAMRNNPALQETFETFRKLWESSALSNDLSTEAALQKTWGKIRSQAPLRSDREEMVSVRRFTWFRVAAAVVITGLIGLIWFLQVKPSGDDLLYTETVNTAGVRSDVILPDGTRVRLAGDSKLRYPSGFTGDLREITLSGEAFFEVKPDSLRPFIVHTANGDIKVLGTSFNISAYEADGEVITAVATGKVSFTPRGSTESVILLPGKKAKYTVSNRMTVLETVTEEAEWAWTKEKFVFQADSLGRIATVLHRYYGKPVIFKNNRYKAYRYTGTFHNQSQSKILEMLNKTRAFPFSVTDTSIIIGN